MDKIENSWSRNYKKTENDTANTYNMTPQEITDNINTKGSSIYEDSIIKGFLKYTNFTGFLLTRVIKELEGVSLEDFKNRTGGSQFLNMEPTEYGTAETKAIHLDLVFEYDHQDVLRLRVDMEPQSSQKAFSISELYTLLSDKVSTKERKVFLEEKHIEERGDRSMDFFEQAVMEAEKAKEDARLAKEDARLAKEDARLAKEKAKIDVEIVERFTEVLSIVKLVSKKMEKGKTYNIIKEELELEDENFLEDVMTIIKENPGCSPKELSAIYLDRV